METNTTLQKRAEKYWHEFCLIFPGLVRFDCPTVKLNNRFSSTIGCNHSEENKIDLASKYFAKFHVEMITTILVHEMAHQIDFNLNGWYARKPHHGKQWIEIMVKLDQAPNAFQDMHL